MLDLKTVSLVVVTSVKHEQNVKALKKSMEGITYGSVKFISDIRPDSLPEDVEYHKIDPITYDGFSEFTFLKLHKYIDTEHSLLVHHDGFVVNPEMWTDDFLKYDYIGAPWPYSETAYITDDGQHVDQGNGGVCLRSKRMLELPTKLGLVLQHRQGFYNDDGNFCVYQRNTFLENGMKYASKELAGQFSTETWIPGISRPSFAFHGFHPHNKIYSEFVNI